MVDEIKSAEFEDDGLEDLESNFLENKVDVDKYINLAIFYCLKSLTNPLGNDVLVIYACAVENLENMCDGAKYLSEDYFLKVKRIKEAEGWGVMPDSPIQRLPFDYFVYYYFVFLFS